jgi:diacylglycerol kinase family enzyme
LARQAAADGFDAVIVLGGDGTVNEVVNGLLAQGPETEGPLLGVVPGGSTNVFTRALGLARDPVEATSELLDALRSGRSRRIGLGQGNGRYFVVNSGLGLDARTVRAVERRRRHGSPVTPGRYVLATAQQWWTGADRRDPAITLRLPDGAEVGGLHLGIVSNATPWTYLGARPVVVAPDAGFDVGLDLFAMRRLGGLAAVRAAAGMLSARQAGPRGRAVLRLHDLAEFSLRADRPLPFQVDGDYVGEQESVSFRAVRQALSVIV